MSKGREWIPLLRRNKKTMMKVNVSPVVLDKHECVSILYWHLSHESKYTLLTMKKKQVKNVLKIGARYISYHGYIEDAPRNREQLISDNEKYGDGWDLDSWDTCNFIITKYFPEFDIYD
jgi:hypothetical protein|tara:strand:- start:236 stop:592 length:357 start_codon:yes stop_codon:yes gene_type:complete